MDQQLPFWKESERGIPNDFARSALFNVSDQGRGGPRGRYVDWLQVASAGGFEVKFRGEELRQDDLDVWLELVQLAKAQGDLGRSVYFNCRGMLKELGRTLNTASRDRLAASIDRLQLASVSVIQATGVSRRAYTGSLVSGFAWHEHGKPARDWTVYVDPRLARLFGATAYTRVDFQRRLQLPPLGKWLQAYFLSHREPNAVSVDRLRALSGSKCQSLDRFQQMTRMALERLVQVGDLQTAVIRNGMVEVQRSPD